MASFNIQNWLCQYFKSSDFFISSLAGDASFRRYYRVHFKNDTYVVMDASAERDKCHQFITVAEMLKAKQLHVPEIFANDLNHGFILLSDMGDKSLLRAVNETNQQQLYITALSELAQLSELDSKANSLLPLFTAQIMREELNLFQEWYVLKHLKMNLTRDVDTVIQGCFDILVKKCVAQPYVVMHRDYHSANLMVLPNDKIGILDFQDAFIGPVTYDLVSLLRDCYIELPQSLVHDLVLFYKNLIKLDIDDATFMMWFDWMGVQRHLKAILTFSRKFQRDNNPNYLPYIPRTLNYILIITSRYPELSPLTNLLKTIELDTEVL